jgi:EAL domain-containing protein (putative c-di-GMP-specific phosphodiesterase class I)
MVFGPARLLQKLVRAPAAGAINKGLKQILKGERIHVVYQPIVCLDSGKLFAYEALARPDPELFDSPTSLFEAAIDAHHVGELGRKLRQMSFDACPSKAGLFVNVYPHEFNEGFLVQPDDPIFWHDEPVYVEITETIPLSEFAYYKGMLQEIRSKGIKIIVDDLGAGYSNLKYISDLAPDVVKVDRELIAGLDHRTRLQRLLRSVVDLCGDLGAKVVAEGIETAGELVAARDAGAQLGQGFFLAKPSNPPSDIFWPADLPQPLPCPK